MRGSMLRLERRCWWCNARLMAVSHAEVEDARQSPPAVVWVHRQCEAETREYFRRTTAQESKR